MKITKQYLLDQVNNSNEEIKNIESDHINNMEYINNIYVGNDLNNKINDENRSYYGKKSEYNRNNKINIESVQRQLLDEIQKQYKRELENIHVEYKEYENKAKVKFTDKELSNFKEYVTKFDTILNKYSKNIKTHLKKHKGCENSGSNFNSKIIDIPIPIISNILKDAKYTCCKKLLESDIEFKKNKKKLAKEYKKTKDEWVASDVDVAAGAAVAAADAIGSNVIDATDADLDKTLMGNLDFLEKEYKGRCERHKYKYDMLRFHHINNCKDCKVEYFQYIGRPDMCGYSECPDIAALEKECLDKTADEFFKFYENEIERLRQYETSVPMKQNITYTVLYAEKIWTKVKSIKILDLEYNKKDDDTKVNEFKKIDEKFYKDFPIIARYMVCLDTYNRNAFSKFLAKLILNNDKTQSDGIAGKSKEGESEERWIELQADYVKYLYLEHNRNKHINATEMKYVWNQTRDLLKKEFGDFKKLYDEKIKQIDGDKKKHTADVARDLVGRLTTIQSIKKADEMQLLEEVKNKIFLQRSRKNINRLLADVATCTLKYIEPDISGSGTNLEETKAWEKARKMKESKKSNPDDIIKNPVCHHYNHTNNEDDIVFISEIKNLVYLENSRRLLIEFINRFQPNNRCIIIGAGQNISEENKWKNEIAMWNKYVEQGNYPFKKKIIVPYSRNLIKIHYIG